MEPQTKSPSPVIDVVAPPAQNAPLREPPAEPKEQTAPPDPKTPAKAKQEPAAAPKSGVGLAIFATVFIVLALASLATYAYLKQNHSL